MKMTPNRVESFFVGQFVGSFAKQGVECLDFGVGGPHLACCVLLA